MTTIRNVQTSLALSVAEFDLRLGSTSITDVIVFVEKATGFRCRHLATKGNSLDVVVAGNVASFMQQSLPGGVDSMIALEKQTIRITYDAKVIGARDLIDYAFDRPLQLAPYKPISAFQSEQQHIHKTIQITSLSIILTVPILVLAWAPLPQHEILYQSISLALATIIQFMVTSTFYLSVLRSMVFTRTLDMDSLVVLSTTTAYLFSVISFTCQVQGRPLPTGGFFETSALLISLIMFGRLVSTISRQKAMDLVSVTSLQAATATLIHLETGEKRTVDIRLLHYDDTLMVSPGSTIPTDGYVLSGRSDVNESMVTGEAAQVAKYPKSRVIAGSMNGNGTMVVRITHLADDNTITSIAAMVDEAKFSKLRTQTIADRTAGYFVPVIAAFTVATFTIWIIVGKVVRDKDLISAVVNAVTYAIPVLIVSCPCAIGLAVPMVVAIASGVAAQNGVIIKTGEVIENCRNINHVILDKTGTVTQGSLSIVTEAYLSQPKSWSCSLLLGLISDIRHPVSSSVAGELRLRDVKPILVENIVSIPGKGVEGKQDGIIVRAGSARWLGVENLSEVMSVLSNNLTAFCLSYDGVLVAVFGLEDHLRLDSVAVVSELSRRGVPVSLVSGDEGGTVKAVASKLGIPLTRTRWRCSPADKQQYVKDTMSGEGSMVLFCGDGTNDAVSLAEAHVGVHVSEGTDMARSAADVILMTPSLRGILTLIDLSSAAYRRIMLNFAWAFIYNVFAILLAAGAFVNIRISPQYAGLGELISIMPVIIIALHLKWFKPRRYSALT